MAKTASSAVALLARLVKFAMVGVVVPLAVGLLQGILQQLDVLNVSGMTVRRWVEWGVVTYIGSHLLLYRPVGLFRASHRLFSTIAVWLFGGQVGSVDAAGGGKGKGAKGEAAAQGSTLVAFSPYVIPLYLMLVCAVAWVLRRWLDRSWVDAPAAFLVGATMAFHWLMTADHLQGQRSRWHIETYLLAIGLVFVVTLLIGGACLPWALPEFSFLTALSDGFSRTRELYATLIQRLFF